MKESIQKVTRTYAGFDDKVTPATLSSYNRLIKNLKGQSAKAQTERDCFEIIKKYTDWFKDNHVGIWFAVPSSPSAIRKMDTRKALDQLKAASNSIEGSWETSDGKEKYVIIKDPLKQNKFIVVTVATMDSAWEPGMIKAEFYYYEPKQKWYRGMYYQKDFNGRFNAFSLKEDHIEHWFGPWWYRSGIKPNTRSETQPPVQFKVLNKDFVYLKLGHFSQWYVNQLDSLIRLNRSAIYQTKNLIIDLRGNGGGNAGSSQEMIQLIYTNPIVYPPWKYRSSAEMIESQKKYVEELKKNDPAKVLPSQQALLERLVAHPGELVSSGDSLVRRADSISHYPERVAFLVDRESGSSSEFFVFEGKQSKKVTLFGSNTAGVMDYGDSNGMNLSCGQYILNVAWGRNGWIDRFGFRIDNIGFVPDVRIPAGEKDWIEFVVKYWSK